MAVEKLAVPITPTRVAGLVIVALIGCRVINDEELIYEMDSLEVSILCNDYAFDEPREVTCDDDGSQVIVEWSFDVQTCYIWGRDTGPECPATAGDLRACGEAVTALMGDEICSFLGALPSQCDAYFHEDCAPPE
ncbi:MAG: hypothetical protein KTR31_36145 [Myxococcales bacterium]|nr:hypothetical protein [Myxococcales bacterium]